MPSEANQPFASPQSVILYSAVFPPHGLLLLCEIAPPLCLNCIFQDSLSYSLTFSVKPSLPPYCNLLMIVGSALCSYGHQDLFLLYHVLF